MNKVFIWIGIVFIVLILAALSPALFARKTKAPEQQTSAVARQKDPIWQQYDTAGLTRPFVPPLSDLAEREVKKPFGIFVTPQNSPIQPERFTGYHTGADFEIFSEELTADVPVSAICGGKLLLKKNGTGYGGYAVQSCTLNGQPVTVLYGHLRLASITPNVGDVLQAGQKFAVLGNDHSSETDGERKHLHVAIHKGAEIVPAGYVQTREELHSWIDPLAEIQE